MKEVFVIRVRYQSFQNLYLCADGTYSSSTDEDTQFFATYDEAMIKLNVIAKPEHYFQIEKFFVKK